MSAPETNIEKQEKRHKPALIGIKGALVFGVAMILLMVFFVLGNGRDDAEGTTGETVGTESSAAPVDKVEPGTNVSN